MFDVERSEARQPLHLFFKWKGATLDVGSCPAPMLPALLVGTGESLGSGFAGLDVEPKWNFNHPIFVPQRRNVGC
jgi:hypothetical protein